MIARGVSSRLASGSIAAGGTLGILIPPSLTFIIYGLATETSIARLFLAGILPGVLLIAIFSFYAFVSSRRMERAKETEPVTFSIREKFSGFLRAGPFLLLVAAVTFAMYGGIATPSEVSALAALLSIVLVMAMYSVTPRQTGRIMISSARESAMVLMIIAASAAYAYMMSYLYITQSLAQWISSLPLGFWGLLFVINIFLFIMGFFLPPVAIILMSMPVLLPVLEANNVDLIWFAVVLTINLEIGLITPPVGLNLFVIRAVAPNLSPRAILLGAMPFVLLMTGFIVLLCFVPQIATIVPDLVMGTQ
ncbi:TRAP transporter, DctM subunit [Roseovarius pacificus]|uniref:TRAP transporter, DctM subunit n=2 Tax=Roseovarius pacificus TaxID=337701 RepID=A0A1M7IIM6_9RHOB|nr:TRAP transporter, DctM subunit [Roseovarius pacificus]